MILTPYKGVMPRIGRNVFIAPGAQIVGDVEIGEDSGIWFNCVLRGDVNDVRIGRRTNIQDGSVIHVSSSLQGTYIGDDVTVGHMALLHACTIEDGAFVGMMACVMDGAHVETGAMVAAGALVTPGKRVPSGQVWAGSPAKFMRDVTAEEKKFIPWSAHHYVNLAREYLPRPAATAATEDPAIAWFNAEAEELAQQYNRIDRRKVHADLLPLLPREGVLDVLDIGAGSGADAALFASLGHRVLALEPAEALRAIAIKTFGNKNITWSSDVLPELPETSRSQMSFDVITAVGVIQYLDQEKRHKSLEKIFLSCGENGLIALQYPVPPSRAHQHRIADGEIQHFVDVFNKDNIEGVAFSVLVDKLVPDFMGRNTADGTPISFRSFILRRVK